ncbi:hypothetical protein BC629DRAFT_430099 [Irpex lacteus]|nr:hypothetical protein BC629DRAFT_430099 [Irpex lacteus]
MGNFIPSSITNSSLQNLIVNGKTLSNPLPYLTTSSCLQSSLKLLYVLAHLARVLHGLHSKITPHYHFPYHTFTFLTAAVNVVLSVHSGHLQPVCVREF